MEKTIQPSELRGYAILALPLAVAGLPLYLHAPDFYVTERGVSLGLLGLLLLLVRVIDAIQDPLIGSLSDTYALHRKWFVLAGVGVLAVGMAALFTPPEFSGAGWFSFWVIVSATAFSMVSINLNALGGIWSRDRYERTRIASFRERYALVGVSIGVIGPGVLVLQFTKATAFAWFVVGLCVILVFSGWIFHRWAGRNPELFTRYAGRPQNAWRFQFPRNKRIRRLLWITLVGTIASSMPAVLFLFFVRDRLMAEELGWVFLVIYFVAALFGITIWRDLSKRSGKVRIWCYSMLLATLSFSGALLVGQSDLVLYGLVCIATGFALGGDLVFPSSLMADFVGESEQDLEAASAGYAWLSFIQKAGLGLAAGLAFPALDLLGFESGMPNTPLAASGLLVMYAGIPLLLKIASVIMAWNSKDLLEGDLNYEKTDNRRNRRNAGDGANTKWMQQSYEN